MDSDRYGNVIRWNARLSRLGDCIVVDSQAGANFHIGRGFDARRFEVILNGIDTDKFQADPAARPALRDQLGIFADTVLVIHVARVDPMKGHATFLRAMCANPGIRGMLVGAGTDKLDLPANGLALRMHTDVERFHPAADIVVSSSAYGEGFSNTVAEGMSAGLVPITTDIGDASRIVGATGLVVPPGDAAGLAAAIGEIAALTAERRRALCDGARARIVDNFAIDVAVTNYECLYSRR